MAEGEKNEPEEIKLASEPVTKTKLSFKQRLKSLFATKKRRILTVLALVTLVVITLLVVPVTRYSILGTVVKKDVSLRVIDSITKKPVSGLNVSLNSKTLKTDVHGVARFSKVPVGVYTAQFTKKYYRSQNLSLTVPVLKKAEDKTITAAATGRTVAIRVTNKITKAAVAGSRVVFEGTTTLTNSEGLAEVVLAPQAEARVGHVYKDGYVDSEVSLVVKNADSQEATVSITPSGTLYFLSKRTGKINVMKSNLDGSNQQVIIEGTGNEEDGETVLLAARNWKNLALLSRREGDRPKLYAINTATKDLEIIDEGSAYFELVGWSGQRFVYKVTRNTPNAWDNKRVALKSYDAESSKLTTLDETFGEGREYWNARHENINYAHILKDEIVYVKDWTLGEMFRYGMVQDKRNAFMSVNADGSNKKRVKEFDSGVNTSLRSRLYAPEEVYISYTNGSSKTTFYEYEEEKIEIKTDINSTNFDSFYPTYLVSPSGSKTFWYEPRDGKNVLFVGNASGEEENEIAVLSEYVPYGWLSDQYILMSKGGSELYISTHDRVLDPNVQPLKITDYHKSQLTYPGYGYGYGGQ